MHINQKYFILQAKFCACLFWLVFHATEDGDFDNIPPEITCPTERDQDTGVILNLYLILHSLFHYVGLEDKYCRSGFFGLQINVLANLATEGRNSIL